MTFSRLHCYCALAACGLAMKWQIAFRPLAQRKGLPTCEPVVKDRDSEGAA